MERETERISVRSLVEFMCRSGDLNLRRSRKADLDAMQKGSRLHRKIQEQMGSGYRKEQTLNWQMDCGDYDLILEGRADGIFTKDGLTVIDEIKGVYLDLDTLDEPVFVHQAQAMCYAYIYGSSFDEECMGLQMTYGNLETEEVRRFFLEFSLEELTEWFQQLIAGYRKWTDYLHDWRQKRAASMETLTFPFPYREGQKQLVSGVYRTIAAQKQLFIQAPTGVGKTLSAIYPSVRAVGEGLAERIFYLTARTTTRTVAEEAFEILRGKGLQFKVITLTAREKICPCEEMVCDPTVCERAAGHFDRVNDAVYELLSSREDFGRAKLEAHAEKWNVCPFEMCLDLAMWTDGVICDYNYVFDPNVRLQRFFGDAAKGDSILLIDEAHNLVDRGREMYSAALYKEDVLAARRQLKDCGRKLTRALDQVNRQLLAYKKECETYEVVDNLGNLPLALMRLQGQMDTYMEEHPDFSWPEESLQLYFAVRQFLNVYDMLDENYVIYLEQESSARFKCKLFCVNPARNIQKCLDMGVGAVFFSATLLPVDYYHSLFSMRKDDYAMTAPSPFPRQRLKVLVGSDVSSRYTSRGYEQYQRIAAYLHKMVCAREGNYMAFFPSYQFLQEVSAIYEEEFLTQDRREIVCLLQNPGMEESDREHFLSQFQEKHSGTLLGFCVMGGMFAEGIDLIGDSLIGAAIVGTGIPQISREREILQTYYDRKQGSGFDYAYRYPGMNKVMQSAGRVIRTQEDRGMILLLDDRFLQPEYLRLFPREWEEYETVTLKSAEEKIRDFWEEDPA